MDETGADLVRKKFAEVEREYRQAGLIPLPPLQPQTIHYTELQPGQPDSELYTEWEVYRRAVGRLLADGHEGQAVLIKGDEVVGVWDTVSEAQAVGLTRFLGQSFLIHIIRAHEPVIRMSSRFWRCPG